MLYQKFIPDLEIMSLCFSGVLVLLPALGTFANLFSITLSGPYITNIVPLKSSPNTAPVLLNIKAERARFNPALGRTAYKSRIRASMPEISVALLEITKAYGKSTSIPTERKVSCRSTICNRQQCVFPAPGGPLRVKSNRSLFPLTSRKQNCFTANRWFPIASPSLLSSSTLQKPHEADPFHYRWPSPRPHS